MKHTQGRAYVDDTNIKGLNGFKVLIQSNQRLIATAHTEEVDTDEEANANALFIADAFNTFDDCGLSPRELAEQNKELKPGLEKIIEMNRQQGIDQYGDAEKAESWACVKVAREALKNKFA